MPRLCFEGATRGGRGQEEIVAASYVTSEVRFMVLSQPAAREVLTEIEASSLDDLKRQLLAAATRYARVRVDWWLTDAEGRRDMDRARRLAHEALIDSCNILSRNMAKAGEDNSWRARLGDRRKVIGDFACHVHCFLGIKAR